MAGRPRSFDRDEALMLALDAFWRQGFDATSISQLTDSMGIAAPSLYAAFGDKRRLFDEAAEQYGSRLVRQTEAALADQDLRRAMLEMLRSAARHGTEPGSPRGCLVMSEPLLRERRAGLRGLIEARISQGRDRGELPADSDVDGLAEYIFALLAGISARARDGATFEQLDHSIALAIGAWPAP